MSNFKTKSRQKAKKIPNNEKPKEYVENAYLYEPILNQIITTNKKCIKYDFATFLKKSLDALVQYPVDQLYRKL